jgi:multiphosphoryl transfer protein
VAAAVAAGLGDALEEVAAEARGALTAKAAHLAPPETERAGVAEPATAVSGSTLRLTVSNAAGLHLRPAAALVRATAEFEATVTVANVTAGRGPVSARSLNAVATLAVRRGDEILLRAEGPQATEALAAIRRLADVGWGDAADERSGREARRDLRPPPPDDGDTAPIQALSPGTLLRGLPASPGIAVGCASRLGRVPIGIADGLTVDAEADWEALQQALAATREDILGARASVAGRIGNRDAEVFDAHLLFLEDEALLGPAREGVFSAGTSAARAWDAAVAAAAASWETLDDPYLRARAADVRSVGDQVLRRLLEPFSGGGADAAGIVVASDLSPADAAGLDPARVRGVACAFGGITSHGAILVRALGIPAVMGAGRALLGVADGTRLLLDADAGTVTVDPPAAEVRAAEARRARAAGAEAEAQAQAGRPAVTRDGLIVSVVANVAGPGDVPGAVASGADGVGLLRTEFLFLQADQLPSEDEQERAYRAAAEALRGRPLVIRTLDVGADKSLPYLDLDAERNPYLGVRGIRLGLRRPELLSAQLRAVLRVAADHPVRVLFPMVTTVDELRQTRGLLDQARDSLPRIGAPVPARLQVGIMVEVPAAALTAEAFAAHIDFFSIGTNDLAQYVLAAERGNAALGALADALHPAVLRLIERTAQAAADGGLEVTVCGELAADPLAVPLLLGLGVTGLSMAAPRIAAAKQAVRGTDVGAARELAAEALAAESAAAVRWLCGGATEDTGREDYEE